MYYIIIIIFLKRRAESFIGEVFAGIHTSHLGMEEGSQVQIFLKDDITIHPSNCVTVIVYCLKKS